MIKKIFYTTTCSLLLCSMFGCSTVTLTYLQGNANLQINTEPQGARVYQKGQLIGTTPVTFSYAVDQKDHERGTLNILALTLVKDGYFPATTKPRLTVASDPSYVTVYGDEAQTVYIKSYDYHDLTILKRDPSAPVTYQHNQNINVQHQKDDLDTMNSGLDALLKLRALTPVR